VELDGLFCMAEASHNRAGYLWTTLCYKTASLRNKLELMTFEGLTRRATAVAKRGFGYSPIENVPHYI
jgi:hypothetical protein